MIELRRIDPVATLRGTLRVPGDKSSSHRALMISALADGASEIIGLSPGLDVAATSRIVEQLGAVRHDHDTGVTVVGPADGLRACDEVLSCANSGTTMRLLSGILSAVPGEHVLTGDQSLSRRPMDRVAEPLTLMGSRVVGQGPRITAPLRIFGTKSLHGIDYRVPSASAQVKSAILLSGLSASGASVVHESVRTRTTTEDMLVHAGVVVSRTDHDAGRSVTLQPSRPVSSQWRIPGDPSQAAFFAVLGVVHPDAIIEVLEIDTAPERVGFVGVLERMGADVALVGAGGGTSLVARSSELRATEIHSREIPSVDEVPILTVAAAAATGVTAFREMGELRVKESDRFASSMQLASILGCRVWSEGDDFFVKGLGSARAFEELAFDVQLDHRMVMACSVAALAGVGGLINGASTVSSSYPNFFDDLAALR